MTSLRSTLEQAVFEQALRELESKSDEEIREELKREKDEIRDDDIKERLYRVPAPPSILASTSSPEYGQQEKFDCQERVRKHLNFFLSAAPAIREFDPLSPEGKALRDAFSHVIASYSLPNTRHWQQFTEIVINAWAFAHSLNEQRLQRKIYESLEAVSKAQGPQREYALFLNLLSIIGIVGTYRCGQQSGGTEEEGRADERFALNLLPVLFHIDCRFFLQQPWISELLADWHDKGEEFYIQHAFFGSTEKQRERYQEETQKNLKRMLKARTSTSDDPKKSRKTVNTPRKQQSYGLLLPQLRRDEKLLTEASYLIKTKKVKADAAYSKLAEDSWAVVGKNNKIGDATVRNIWSYRDEADKRLQRLFKWDGISLDAEKLSK
jgi:hypothetical protein